MSMSSPRCEQCNKKVGLMGQKCKCDKLLCISHLHAEEHGCTYDYKSDTKNNLKKNAEKIADLSVKLVRI